MPIAVPSTPLFSNVARDTMESTSGQPIDLPEELSFKQEGDVVLTACFARLPAGGELRSVHIHGPRIEIINVFHFPAHDRALPVYAMEFVVFGRRPIVGVIDAKPLTQHPFAVRLWQDALTEAHSKFPDLIPADDPPPWYEDCRSGLDFFTRPMDIAGMRRLLDCHYQIWSSLASEEENAPHIDGQDAAAHSSALTEYKDHHRINSPGLPFLHRTFGQVWTDKFLRTALFS